ncbi:hypothetical protein N9D61_03420 [Planktomarina sp.]|nr:hypothetical protein [Planktomarina sp.]
MSTSKYNLQTNTTNRLHLHQKDVYAYAATNAVEHSAALAKHNRRTAIRLGVASFLALALFTIIIALPVPYSSNNLSETNFWSNSMPTD